MENTHLFITIPSKSGSSWLARILYQCEKAISFGGVLEGKGLLTPSEFPKPDRHKCEFVWTEIENEYYKSINWKKLRKKFTARWKKEYELRGIELNNKYIFMDKCVQYVIIAPILEQLFPNSKFIISIRNPYATIEGILRVVEIRRKFRYLNLRKAINHWIRTAQLQFRNIHFLKNVIWITYEQLCRDPNSVQERIKQFIPELYDIDFLHNKAAAHTLEGGGTRGIVTNLNYRQIHRLNDDQFYQINKRLTKHKSLMNFFGYKIIESKEEYGQVDSKTSK
jgi:hypothetical protein